MPYKDWHVRVQGWYGPLDPDKPNILNWFDIENPEHLRAYKELRQTGVWPMGFIPAGMQFQRQWDTLLMNELADAFIDAKLAQVTT